MITIEKTWRVQTEWWRGDDERIDRQSHEVTTREGLRCACLHDRAGEQWHLASIDA